MRLYSLLGLRGDGAKQLQWIGMLEYIPCYGGPAEHWGILPATRLASREILIEQNVKTGPALCVLCVHQREVGKTRGLARTELGLPGLVTD
jgi:hypothetical protein